MRHYGLAPSKNKAVAKTRLLDAVNAGKLEVPKDIKAIETQLAKEWAKKHREARAALKKAEPGASKETSVSKESKATSKKRKADANDEAVSQTTVKKVAKAAPMKEKGNTTKLPITAAPQNSTTAKTKVGSKTAAAKPKVDKNAASKSSSSAKSMPAEAIPSKPIKSISENSGTDKKPRTKQTARRGGANLSGRGRPQTARRGGSSNAASGQSRSYETNYDGDEVKEEETDSGSDEMDYQYAHGSSPPSPAFGSLGLLNGTYDITCDDLREWSMYDDADFNLIMALQGTEIWISYDFGMFSGIIHVSRRPFEASDARIEFTWRGVENSEGTITYNGHDGYSFWVMDRLKACCLSMERPDLVGQELVAMQRGASAVLLA